MYGCFTPSSFGEGTGTPHIDAEYGVVAELKENIVRLPESAQRKILGENAAKIYCLPM